MGPAVAQVSTFGNCHINLQYSPFGQYDVTMNTTNPPFNDVNVRKAVVMGINWSALLTLYGGLNGTTRAYAPVAEDSWAFGPNTPKVDYDPTRAALLSTTNVKQGETVTFIIYAGRKPSERDIIVSNLETLGFNVNLKLVDTATFYSDWVVPVTAANYGKNPWNITMQSNGVSIPDPDGVFREYYLSNSPDWNPAGYSNPQVDSLLAQGIVETDQTKRAAIYQQICEITTAAFVYPGTYRIYNHNVWNNKLQGYREHVLYVNDWSKAWLSP